MNLEVIKYIKSNPNTWRDLLKDKPYCLEIKEDEHYCLLKYNQIESDFSLDIVKECRGLIVDKITLEPVALSFKKFFNVQETYADEIDWTTAHVQEKVDGSKLCIFWDKYEQRWQVCTSGSLDAYEANVGDFGLTFGDLFEKALANNLYTKDGFFLNLIKSYCYTFELVSPESRIVVPYKKADLYFIGCRNVETFEETKPELYNELFGFLLKTPKEYPLKSLEDCLEATKQMSFNEEGYVVVDNYWNRIKIKSPAYVAGHHLRGEGTVSSKRILEMIETGAQDDFLAIYPEYSEYFSKVLRQRHNFINYLIKGYRELREFSYSNNNLVQKDYAIWIMNNYKDISSFLFNCLKYGLDNEYNLFEWWEKLDINKKLTYLEER